jgi:hypothetical protein
MDDLKGISYKEDGETLVAEDDDGNYHYYKLNKPYDIIDHNNVTYLGKNIEESGLEKNLGRLFFWAVAWGVLLAIIYIWF